MPKHDKDSSRFADQEEKVVFEEVIMKYFPVGVRTVFFLKKGEDM